MSLIMAWIVILATAGVWLSLDSIMQEAAEADDSSGAVGAADDGDSAEPSQLVGFKEIFMGKVVVTLVSLESVSPATNRGFAAKQIEPLVAPNQPPVAVVCGAILLARVGDLSAALDAVHGVIQRVTKDPTCAPAGFLEVALLVEAGILDIQDPLGNHELSDSQAAKLEATMGWFGELLNSTDEANPTFEAALESSAWTIALAMCALLVLGAVAAIGGFVWLVIVAAKWAGGKISAPLAEPIHTPSTLPWIFAGWFGLTLLLSIGVALIATRAGRLDGGLPLVLQLASMLLPLVALLIGRRRGVSWSQVCHDVGLHCGRGFWREFFYGFTVWATAIPMVIAGAMIAFVLSLLLSAEFADAEHPLPEAIAQGSLSTRLVLLFLAAVAAPVVEEIVFRGVLFRHLRDLSHTWGRGLSFVVAALGSSFVFAAIHPQGILFIPILGALAFAFCLAREMRGSLISCIVAHGFHNGLITTFVMVLSS